MQVLSSQDVGPSGGSDHSRCYNPYWWGGPWQRRRRSFFPGYSKDLDASSAFEVSYHILEQISTKFTLNIYLNGVCW